MADDAHNDVSGESFPIQANRCCRIL